MIRLLSTLRNGLRNGIDGIIYLESLLYRSPHTDTTKKRILILRKDGLGDCIIFYPTLRAYREYYKDAEITLVFPRYFESLSPLLTKDLVDNVIWFDHKAFGTSFSYRRTFLLDLKRNNYDVFIYPVFSRETIGFFMMKMANAPERIGFAGDISLRGKKAEERGTLSYTKLIEPPETMKSEIDRDIYFAEEVTHTQITVKFPTMDIRLLPPQKRGTLYQEKLTGKRYAVIFPGAGAPYRIWPHEKFAAIVDYIHQKGILPVLAGSPKETELSKDILSKALHSKEAIDISGQTDLAELAHILSRAEFYFGSDTGILHLAVAIGTPAVAIVGAGGLDRFFPYGDPKKNKAVYDKTRTYKTGAWHDIDVLSPGEIHPSIRNITVEEAKSEIDNVLGNKTKAFTLTS